jgi:hypothetical protein
MSGFRDMVSADLDIFINGDEFAEDHDLNGTLCKAVIDTMDSKENFFNSQTYEPYGGISGRLMKVYVKASDLPEIPAEGTVFRVDDEPLIINKASVEMGVVVITLHGSEG